MKANIPNQENSPELEQGKQNALDEISAVRDSQRRDDLDRKQQFELVYEGSLLSGHDVWSLKPLEKATESIDPDKEPDEDLER